MIKFTAKLRSIALVMVFAMVAHASAVADVVEYTDRDRWTAAADGFTTIGFSELPHGAVVTDQYTSQGVLFTDGIDVVLFSPTAFPNDEYGLYGAINSITVSFATPMMSIAVDHPGSVQFELYSNGELIYLSTPFLNSGVGYFSGLISQLPFDTARIFDPLGNVNIDDLHFGPPIPAPGALALLLSTAAIVRGRRRNR